MRLNIERQNELEPRRMEYARNQITALGYEIIEENATDFKIYVQRIDSYVIPVFRLAYRENHTGRTGYWETIKTDTPIKEEPPDVTDTPGVRYAVTESDVMV